MGEGQGEVDLGCFMSDFSLNASFSSTNIPDIVDFPTPPLAEETAIIFFTSLICRFCGRPLCIRGMVGGAPLRGSPYTSSAFIRMST